MGPRMVISRGAVMALLTLAAVALGFRPVRAGTITVNSTADTTAHDAACTLREAIANVNAAAQANATRDTTGGDCAAGTGTGDTIVFKLSLPATITLTDAALDIEGAVRINGPTTGTLAVDGNGQAGVLSIVGDTPVTVADLTIQHGVGSLGGGVYNEGTLTLTRCTLSGNAADEAGGAVYNLGSVTLSNCTLNGNSSFDGGAVYNDAEATATLSDCTLSDNSATNDAGGGGGGAVYNDGTLTLANCTLNDNSAPNSDGGGLYSDGDATLTNCTVRDNFAANDAGGGGIYNEGGLTLANCTLSGNSAYTGDGGGLYNQSSGEATLTNCTVSGDASVSGQAGGGGVYNDGMLTLTNCTLSGNSATDGDGGGLYNDTNGTATLTNTIVANNTPSGHNCAGTEVEGDHNLSSDATCFAGANLLNTAPRLAPLGNYGGPTLTLALCTAPGTPALSCSGASPAIDAGDNAHCPATDQRGVPRPQGAACDIGAYESGAVPPATATPTSNPTGTPTFTAPPTAIQSPTPTTPVATPTPPPTAAQSPTAPAVHCVGDCDDSGEVTVNELITLVNITLGNTTDAACPNGIPSGAEVNITLIIKAVNNALNGCSGG
jgi:CSLREA domain-containing protein